MTISLPLPPSANHIHFSARGGQRVLTDEARTYKTVVTAMVQRHMKTMRNIPSFDAGIVFMAYLYFPTKRKRDLDGGLKILQDAVCKGLDTNDNRVDEIHLYRRIDKMNSRAVVTVAVVKEVMG